MKVIIKGQINYRPSMWEGEGPYHFHPCDLNNCVKVMDHEIEVEIPDDFDPRGAQIAALEKEKTALRAAFQKSITDIERKISELLALDNIPGAV